MPNPASREPVVLTNPVLTALEVAVCLRLCDEDATPNARQSAIRSVHRLVQFGKLRPIQPGKEYVFSRNEVARYVTAETEAFKPRRRGQ